MSWINGRSQKLSDGRVMSQVLNAELNVQKHALKEFKRGNSYASQGLARTSLGARQRKLQMYRAEVVSINDLILAYNKLINDQGPLQAPGL